MGSSPIARSIFFLIAFFSLSPVLAQVTADKSLPFQEGETVLLPANAAYLGDLPHFIDVVLNETPFHTFGGLQVPQVGWSDPLGQNVMGLRSANAGFFFESIPYPLNAAAPNLLPAGGTLQMLNFPAQGWLGPSAAYGALNITAPDLQDRWSNQAYGWGGTGTGVGLGDRFVNSFLGADLNYRHSNAIDASDSFSLVSKEKWLSSDGFTGGTGFLGALDGPNDNWYSAFLDMKLLSPNFQSLEFKPYIQSAQSGSQNAQDYGGFLNYLFNLAGLAESHVGLGYDSVTGSPGIGGNKGFLQSTNLVDILGDITFDGSVRWDLSDQRNTAFSTVLGVEGKLDVWTLLTDYDKGVSPVDGSDIQQADAGFRLQPGDDLSLTARYIYEQLGSTPFNGFDLRVQVDEFNGFGFFYRAGLNAEERMLVDENGNTQYDSGAGIRVALTSQDHWWFEGRCVGGEAVFLEAGADYSLDRTIKFYGSFDDLTGVALALPDMDRPAGFVTSVGVQFSTD